MATNCHTMLFTWLIDVLMDIIALITLELRLLACRWQHFCHILCSFNATLMLETLRGKRMMFVGDSLNRGQYVSMVCLLHRLIPEDQKSMETFGSLTVFTAKVNLINFLLQFASHHLFLYIWNLYTKSNFVYVWTGIQCNNWVLLGTISPWIKLGWCCHS